MISVERHFDNVLNALQEHKRWDIITVQRASLQLAAIDNSDLKVIMSVEFYPYSHTGKPKGPRWIHLSCSREGRVPSYQDLTTMKKLFLGDDLAGIMVLPKQEEHVNIHPNCLHLFCPYGFDPLPDFRVQGMI